MWWYVGLFVGASDAKEIHEALCARLVENLYICIFRHLKPQRDMCVYTYVYVHTCTFKVCIELFQESTSLAVSISLELTPWAS